MCLFTVLPSDCHKHFPSCLQVSIFSSTVPGRVLRKYIYSPSVQRTDSRAVLQGKLQRLPQLTAPAALWVWLLAPMWWLTTICNFRESNNLFQPLGRGGARHSSYIYTSKTLRDIKLNNQNKKLRRLSLGNHDCWS